VTNVCRAYLETVILVEVSSRIFLIIFPSLPIIRPQYRSSDNIFNITSLPYTHTQQQHPYPQLLSVN